MEFIRFLKSFGYAGKGVLGAVRTGRNLRFQLAVVPLAVCFGVLAGITAEEWCCLILCCAAVLGGEIMNSALEAAVDLSCQEYNEAAGMAKDMAAGAVLLRSLAAVGVGLFLFLREGRLWLIWDKLCAQPVLFAILVVYLALASVFIFKKRGKTV